MNVWTIFNLNQNKQEDRSRAAEMEQRLEARLSDLAREKAFLSGILSALEESVVAVDETGRIVFINPAAEKLFGVQALDVKDRMILEGLRHSPLNDVLVQTLTTQLSVTQEIAVHSPDEHILSARTVPVNYGQGQTGALAALHDITELRKLENVRREFVANVSHELKTPLTSIKGYVETLLDGAIDDPKNNRDFLQTIQDHANNLSRLIDDVLDLSTIEAQRVPYRFEPVALQDVVERIVKALDPMAKTKKVSILRRARSRSSESPRGPRETGANHHESDRQRHQIQSTRRPHPPACQAERKRIAVSNRRYRPWDRGGRLTSHF